MSSLQKVSFTIDSISDLIFEGYANDTMWNGWACPYFEKSEAECLLQASEANGYVWSYDSAHDAFIVRSEDDPEDYAPEVFRAVSVIIEGKDEATLYGIGAYSWVWERVLHT